MDWESASNLATAVGLPIAALGAWTAVLTYRAQIESTADAHMHQLFRDYLAKVIEYEDADPSDLRTLALYTFEEMCDWVHEQERELKAWGWLRTSSVSRRRTELAAWRETIRSHLRPDIEALQARVAEYAACYGDDFRRLVATTTRGPPVAPPAPVGPSE